MQQIKINELKPHPRNNEFFEKSKELGYDS